MSIIFAFDVGVVIFVIRPRASELDGDFAESKIFEKRLIAELMAVIGIEAEDGERQ